MSNIVITAINKKPESEYGMVTIKEWRWRPIRSILAIANHRIYQKTGRLPLLYRDVRKLDDNSGFKIEDPDICEALGKEMLALKDNPIALADHGISVEIEKGEYIYSYPVYSCTACLERKDDQEYITKDDDYTEDNVRSCFWTPEDCFVIVSEFIRDSGGISLL